MKNKNIPFGFFVALVFLTNCGNSDGWQGGADGIYQYKILSSSASSATPHASINTAKIDFGDEISFSYAIYKGDSVLERTEAGQWLQLLIPARQFRNPWEQALMQARLGDSLVVRARMRDVGATMQKYENLFSQQDWVVSHFKIHSVRRRDSLAAAEKQDLAAMQRFSSAAAFTKEHNALALIADSLPQNMAQWYFDVSQGKKQATEDAATKMRYEILPFSANFAANFELLQPDKIAKQGDTLLIYYATMLSEGLQIYDNSLARRSRFELVFRENPSIIEGFHAAAAQLKTGQRGFFLLPPALGYGAAGSPPVVPPNSQIILYMHVVGVAAK
jgi:FKBP-type peptidyl-prolyl cis-trans isomerase